MTSSIALLKSFGLIVPVCVGWKKYGESSSACWYWECWAVQRRMQLQHSKDFQVPLKSQTKV